MKNKMRLFTLTILLMMMSLVLISCNGNFTTQEDTEAVLTDGVVMGSTGKEAINTEQDTEYESTIIVPMVEDSKAIDLKDYLDIRPEDFANQTGLEMNETDENSGEYTGYDQQLTTFWSSNNDGYSIWYTGNISHLYFYQAQPQMSLEEVDRLFTQAGLRKDTSSGMEQYFINDTEYITVEYDEENVVLALKYAKYIGN